ncbi:ABC transporter ATP-binding protein [Gordonia rhizosphera]|uniref:Putative peptide ABC transporter ATP-binding protein n=1 Tax=Gordonia rhizosphera NBRC 16068 TaxID=1108045 RepID=K6WFT1_9ACTN|nr:ABC transporter ATP-binding protein [Gordonia rhizosphera]GAB91032.1 putative peptide ABC transporter ATP-binding protein [Gordonia rhizosphera NBRC 16068]
MSTVIEVVDVRKTYGRHVTALDGVTAMFESGRSVGIVGESGSGKSSLGRMLVGLSTPTSGQVLVNGRDLRQLRRRSLRLEFLRAVQQVAQDTTTTFDPRHTVREAVRTPAQILGGMDKAAADDAVDAIVEELGIGAELVDRYPHELSGGQRQRLSIARSLIVRPDILICDEAVSALDVSAQAVVLNVLKQYVRSHSLGLVFISHGLPATAFITDELLVMNAGVVVEEGDTATVLGEPSHAYTRQLVEAFRTVETAAA